VVQVELLRLLHTKMKDLSGSLRAGRMPRPRFRMCILYVDEHESVQRQLSRGRQALEHNKHVKETGEGDLCEVRETDLSVKAAKTRYRLFVDGTMAANEALKRNFPFNLINASGTIEEVKAVVLQELSYQSSLELAEDTYNAIRHIPTAAEITRHARVNLVARLDSYQRIHPAAFAGVVRVINDLFLPAIRRHALSNAGDYSAANMGVHHGRLVRRFVTNRTNHCGYRCAEPTRYVSHARSRYTSRCNGYVPHQRVALGPDRCVL
jgi:hypothetical protein